MPSSQSTRQSIVDDEFVRNVWRRKPAVLRVCVSERALAPVQLDDVHRLCRKPVAARIFVLKGETRDRGESRLIPDPAHAWEIYNTYRREERLTLLLNSVEKVDTRLAQLQDMFSIPFGWRRDDVVCSVSTAGSGIGFHAGREDGFVVQVSGSRRWRVWAPDVVGDAHRRFLLGDDRHQPPPAPRTSAAPLVDCVLEPGDALYTPAMFAHEGETVEESVSLSLAWAGVTAYHVLAGLRDLDSVHLAPHQEQHLMVLLPDVVDEEERVGATITFLEGRFRELDGLRPSRDELETYVRRLVSCSVP